MSLADDLYERDFYAWTLEQADALRGRGAGANALDYDNLVEEVEGLGRSELHGCESVLKQIVWHAMKIASADEAALTDLPHWRAELTVFRDQIGDYLTPALRSKLEERAPVVINRTIKAWREIDRSAADTWRIAPPTLAQCLDENWFPEPGARTLTRAEAA